MKKTLYAVYFDQVNAEMIAVEATSKEDAAKKAMKQWAKIHNNAYPDVLEHIENNEVVSERVYL